MVGALVVILGVALLGRALLKAYRGTEEPEPSPLTGLRSVVPPAAGEPARVPPTQSPPTQSPPTKPAPPGALPLVLADNVLWPGRSYSPTFHGEKTMAAVRQALAGDGRLFHTRLARTTGEVAPEAFHTGTFIRVLEASMEGSSMRVRLVGESRGRLTGAHLDAAPWMLAEVDRLEDEATRCDRDALLLHARHLYRTRGVTPSLDELSAGAIADHVAADLGLPVESEQDLLDDQNVVRRVARVREHLTRTVGPLPAAPPPSKVPAPRASPVLAPSSPGPRARRPEPEWGVEGVSRYGPVFDGTGPPRGWLPLLPLDGLVVPDTTLTFTARGTQASVLGAALRRIADLGYTPASRFAIATRAPDAPAALRARLGVLVHIGSHQRTPAVRAELSGFETVVIHEVVVAEDGVILARFEAAHSHAEARRAHWTQVGEVHQLEQEGYLAVGSAPVQLVSDGLSDPSGPDQPVGLGLEVHLCCDAATPLTRAIVHGVAQVARRVDLRRALVAGSVVLEVRVDATIPAGWALADDGFATLAVLLRAADPAVPELTLDGEPILLASILVLHPSEYEATDEEEFLPYLRDRLPLVVDWSRDPIVPSPTPSG